MNGLLPIGSIVAFAGWNDSTNGWAICDGRLLSRTTYATLYALSGFNYNGGVDPGGNTFRIPDLRGRIPEGAINQGTGGAPNDNGHHQASTGQTGGEVFHVLTGAELTSHQHVLTDTASGEVSIFSYSQADAPNAGPGTSGRLWIAGWSPGSNQMVTSFVGSSQGHGNIPPVQAVSYWIRII